MRVTELWAGYLPHVRWFQGKGLPLREVSLTPLDWYATAPALSVRSELARIDLGETFQTYHLVVGYAPAGTAEPAAVIGQATVEGLGLVDVLDAPCSEAAMGAVLGALRAGAPGMVWHGAPPGPAAGARLLMGEQSNTNLRVGQDMLLKIYRRLGPGHALEARVLADLGRHAARVGETVPITPALLGTWSTPDGARDLGFFSELVPHARDGYEYAVQACGEGLSLAEPMRALGDTLARLHRQLRQIYGSSAARAPDLVAAVRERLDRASLDLAELAPLHDRLSARLAVPGEEVVLQRIHGDFHLGQALLGPHGWVLIDFEGEPLKPFEERGAPDTAWRDVAGLLRSLDYVRHTHPEPDGAPARQWLRDARAGFLAGYGADAPPLLGAYEIDKAVYELRYEIRNRPAWVSTPLGALRDLAGLSA